MTFDATKAVFAAVLKVWNPNTLSEDTLYFANRNAFSVGTNLVTSPDAVTTGAGWTLTGSVAGSAAFSHVGAIPMTRLSAVNTGQVARTAALTGNGVKRFSVTLQFDGVAGTSSHGIFDASASYIALATVTWTSAGAASAVAAVGSIVQFVAIGDHAYRLTMDTIAATAAHTNTVYAANLSGADTVTSIRVGRVIVQNAAALSETVFTIRLTDPAFAARTAFADRTTSGRGTVSKGSAKLNNAFGALDLYRTYGWDGRSYTLYLGQAGQEFNTEFSVVLDASMLPPQFSQDDVTIPFRDWQRAADVPIQTDTFAGDNVLPDGLEGVADLEGKPKPFLAGIARNVEPVCVNTSKLIYQYYTGDATADAVYDEGVALAGGFSWTRRTFPLTAHDELRGAAFGASTYVVVGGNGTTPTSFAATSPDGVTWTKRVLTGFTGFNSVIGVRFGNAKFVAFGAGGLLSTSSDGITWTSRTSNMSDIRDAVYSTELSLWCAVGGGGAIATSSDGVTWTAQTSGTIESLFGVATGKKQFVAVGDVTTVLTSIDGVTWVNRTVAMATTHYLAVAFDSARGFLASGIDYVSSTGPGMSALSADGITWERRDGFLGAHPVSSIAPGLNSGSPIVAVAEGGVSDLGSSITGRVWTVRSLLKLAGGGAPSQVNCIALCNADYLAVGFDSANGGEIWQSVGGFFANTTDLEDDTKAPLAGSFMSCPTSGYFRLGSSPAGKVTADVSHATTSAGYQFAAVLALAGFVTGDWNPDDITTLNTANSAPLGYYTTESGVTCAEVLDRIAQSVGAWWSTDRSGVIRIKRLDDPSINVVTNPDTLTAGAGWSMAGTVAGSAAFSQVGAVPLTRVTNAAAVGSQIARVATFTTNGVKRLSLIVQWDGVSGTTQHGLFDNTSSAFLASVTLTWTSTGTATAFVSIGTLVRFVALGSNAYVIVVDTLAATAAHVNVVYPLQSASTTSTRIGRVMIRETIPTATLSQDADMDGMTNVASGDPNNGIPVYRSVIRYSRNYMPLAGSELAGAVSDDARALFGAEWLDTGTAVDTAVQTAHPLATQRMTETLITELADASAEATRRQSLDGVQRHWFDVPVFVTDTTSSIELGDVVELVSSRYGCEGGQNVVVLGIRPNLAGSRITFSVWG